MPRPYLAREIKQYLSAYATYSIILDAYDEVNGCGSTLTSHQFMDQHLAGTKNGTETLGENSIVSLYINYYNKNKYIFVDKGRAGKGIYLNPEILVKSSSLLTIDGYESAAPGCLTNMPLTEDQVKHLAEYANGKNISLFSFLFNKMGFVPRTLSKAEIESLRNLDQIFYAGNKQMLEYAEEVLRQESAKTYFASNGKGGFTASGNPYFAAGRQSFEHVQDYSLGRCAPPRRILIKAIHATNGSTSPETIKVWDSITGADNVILFFQGA